MKTKRMALAAILAVGMLSTSSFAEMAPLAPAGSAAGTVPAETLTTFILNGKTVTATVPDGMLPLRLVSETLGYTVTWQPDTQSVTFQQGQNTPRTLTAEELSGGILRDGRWYLHAFYYSEMLGNTVIIKDTGETVIETGRYAPDEASTLGVIKEVVQGKDGIQILVSGQKFGSQGYDEISLAVERTVPVLNGTLGDLKKDDLIYVKYDPSVTKSLPPMGRAISVELLKEENLLMGKIMDISQGNGAEISRIRVIGTSDFVLGLTKDTVITGADGKVTTQAALKEGMIVKVYTSPIAALSMPPQTGAYRIFIQ